MKRSLGFQVLLSGRVCPVFILMVMYQLAGLSPLFSQSVQDQTSADFSQGTLDQYTAIVPSGDGAVSLKSFIPEEEFNEDGVIPAGWESFSWSTGGSSVVSGNVITITGSRLNTVPSTVTYGPGCSMEFVAIFGADEYQFAGFGGGDDGTGTDAIYRKPPLATFTIRQLTNTFTLYARVSIGAQTDLYPITGISPDPIGFSHTYRIEWRPDGYFEFYIDNSLVHTSLYAITEDLRPAFSDYNIGTTPSLILDRVSVIHYPALGTFMSRDFDAGEVSLWGTATWNENVPSGTSLSLSVRVGDALPLSGAFTSVTSGQEINLAGRYLQYKTDFATADQRITAQLLDIVITYSDIPLSPPSIIAQPQSETVCSGSSVSFSTDAIGTLPLIVQWQEYVFDDPDWAWTDIGGATESTLSFITDESDDGKQYRAVWSNSEGEAISNAVTLTVHPVPQGYLTPAMLSVYEGETYDLVFTSTVGTGPYSLVINGETFQDVVSGASFLTGTASHTASIWPESTVVESENINTQNDPTELGVMFRSSVTGTVHGIRFYYRPDEYVPYSGTFTVSLWDPANQTTPMASVTSEVDNFEGWKQISFTSPVSINADVSYMASYNASDPYYYAYNALTAPLSVTNGVLSTEGCFFSPTPGAYPGTSHNANYWVDIAFDDGSSIMTYNLTSVSDSYGCTTTVEPAISSVITVNPANVWLGTTPYPNWNYSGNWSDGDVPDGTDVVIPVASNGNYPEISGVVAIDDLTVSPLAEMSVNAGGSLTVNGDLTTSGAIFSINSTAVDNSGSLIVNGAATGDVTYNRLMPTGTVGAMYRYISSPVSTTTLPIGFTFWKWNEEDGYWGDTSAENPVTECESGRGYTMSTTGNTVAFTGGVLNALTGFEATAPFTTPYTQDRATWGGGGWNLLGNPFPSALRGIDEDEEDANDFIHHNLTSFDPSYQAMYIYNGADYSYIAEGTPGYPSQWAFDGNDVQAGQGFFVLAHHNGVAFDFTGDMRTHNTTAVMTKSASTEDNAWPGLQLNAKYGDKETSTLIVYHDQMTADLDPGYDVGLLSSGADVEIYTLLASGGNDFSFTRQALPTNGSTEMVIPVGIDSEKGGEVVFSAYTIPLGTNKFWLEDRQAGIFTDLSSKSYTVALPSKSYGTGRFYIIASTNTPTDINIPDENSKLRMWPSNGNLIIQGSVTDRARCEIFDVDGTKILERNLTGGDLNRVDVSILPRGIVIVRVTDGTIIETKKIAIF